MGDHFQNVGTAFAKYRFAIKKGVFIENRFNPENCRIRWQLPSTFHEKGISIMTNDCLAGDVLRGIAALIDIIVGE